MPQPGARPPPAPPRPRPLSPCWRSWWRPYHRSSSFASNSSIRLSDSISLGSSRGSGPQSRGPASAAAPGSPRAPPPSARAALGRDAPPPPPRSQIGATRRRGVARSARRGPSRRLATAPTASAQARAPSPAPGAGSESRSPTQRGTLAKALPGPGSDSNPRRHVGQSRAGHRPSGSDAVQSRLTAVPAVRPGSWARSQWLTLEETKKAGKGRKGCGRTPRPPLCVVLFLGACWGPGERGWRPSRRL